MFIVYRYKGNVVKTVKDEEPPLIGDKIITMDYYGGPATFYRVIDRVLEIGYRMDGTFFPYSHCWTIELEKGWDEKKTNID